MPAPICAVVTPPGRAAIATIALAGEDALSLVATLFQSASKRPLTAHEVGSTVFGKFQVLEGKFEELVVGLPRAGRIEIHCHGGQAAVTAICSALVAKGAILVGPDRYARETAADALTAAALIDLSEAKTARTAAILLDQYRGALRGALTDVVQLLDAGSSTRAKETIDTVLTRAPLGLHLTTPWCVVLTGPPNAGKSSLMNALMGFQRAIVFPEPGTTRDVLSALTAIDGWPVELFDTAGLRETDDSLEATGVNRARRELTAADLVIFVADVTTKWNDELFNEVITTVSRAPALQTPLVLVAHNKSDLGPAPSDQRAAGLAISALTGLGIEELCKRISQALVPHPVPPGCAVPFNEEQVVTLKEVSAKITAGGVEQARTILRRMLGSAS
jgi:tRNA modification GTPase